MKRKNNPNDDTEDLKFIDLDGSENALNLFAIIEANEETCCSNHRSRIVALYNIMAGLSEHSNEENPEIIMLKKSFKEFYSSYRQFSSNKHITSSMSYKQHPNRLDFETFIKNKISMMETETSNGSSQDEREIKQLEQIQCVISHVPEY